jgi:teichuronic acid biosynthesis glycosyltransferase TuaC
VPTRIALISTSYPTEPGDFAGHFVQAEARSLATAGHDVTVFTAGSPGVSRGTPTVVRIADGGATGPSGVVPRLRSRPWRGLGLAGWVYRTRRELQRHGRFDRVVAHFVLPVALPLLSSPALRGAELDIVVHGSDLRLLEKVPAPLSRWLITRLLALGVSFRCVSGELLALLERLTGQRLGTRGRVEPVAIDVSAAPDRARARRGLGLSEERALVVVIGRLIPSKRVGDALLAARLVPNVEVVVIGDGPELARLRRDFPEVRCVGALSRPLALRYVAAADVLLSASRLEGAPTAIREARALGVPVVSNAAGDLTEWARTDAALWVVASP